MSHRHYCDYAGHHWQCDGAALRGADTEPSLCMCFDHGVPMEDGDHSRCTIELVACSEHREAGLVPGADELPPCGANAAARKGRIMNPPWQRLRRALRRASRRGFVGACVWCSHGYRRFSLEIQAAHLKDCAKYQRAKQRLPENLEGKN